MGMLPRARISRFNTIAGTISGSVAFKLDSCDRMLGLATT